MVEGIQVKRHHEGEVVARRAAGIKVGGHSDRDACVAKCPGGEGKFLEVERGERQAHSHGVRVSEGADAVLRNALQVIGGGGVHLGGEGRAPCVRQLIGVQLGAKAVLPSGIEQCAGLVRGKGTLFHEGVAELGEIFVGHTWDHFVADELLVPGAVVLILRRDGVGAEKREHDLQGLIGLQQPVHAELLEFVLHRKPVSTFRLRPAIASRNPRQRSYSASTEASWVSCIVLAMPPPAAISR
jgi:hypothetical protein